MSGNPDAASWDWTCGFRQLYEKGLSLYRAGGRNPHVWFSPGEQQFLASIGARPTEVFDFVEDADEISWETALLITSARRDYFLQVQHGSVSTQLRSIADFPAKKAELDGIRWLPRLILKAKSRLRGELPDELMYCCGGDRNFFRQHSIHPADFLRFIWSAGKDESRILHYVRSAGRQHGGN
jgi:hypothetical protein